MKDSEKNNSNNNNNNNNNGNRSMMMVRSRTQIKKIEDVAARQVTFSKRRKGLLKKAHELSTLCDAEIAVMIFSSSGKLHDFSSSSRGVTQVIQKYMRQTGNVPEQHDPTIFEPYLLEADCASVRKEFDQRRQELSRMQGEGLEGLSVDELRKLERQIEQGYARVSRMKDDKLQKVIIDLKRKENTLVEHNKKLEQKINNATEGEVHTLKKQSEELAEAEQRGIQNNVSFDTSLRLGLL